MNERRDKLGEVVTRYESLGNDVAHVVMKFHQTQRFTLTIDPLDKAGDEDAITFYGSWKSDGKALRLVFDEAVNANLFEGADQVERISKHQYIMPYEAENVWIYGIQCTFEQPE